MDEREVQAASRPILSGWITQGPEVEAFEREFSAIIGTSYACAVSSCTTALHLALLAVGVRPGDDVITVSQSFIASANSIRYCGARPIFIDIQPDTCNMDPALIERAITERTRAILCVHQMGMPCDLQAIIGIARRYQLPVVEDAACAVGSQVLWEGRWEPIGKPHGDIACFSFHPRKIISTGDGGMLTTSNIRYDQQFRLLRHHGMTIPDTQRHNSGKIMFESYEQLGYNYRMTDIQGAVGREQLKRLPDIVKRRRQLADRYASILAGDLGLRIPVEPDWARSNWQSYCVRLPTGVDQRRTMQAMLDRGVSTRRGIMCAHRESAYHSEHWTCGVPSPCQSCPPSTCDRLKQSEHAQNQTIILPLFPQMTESDQDAVAHALRESIHTSK